MTFSVLLVAIGAYFVSETYARYTEQVTKSGKATVAKWDFATDNANDPTAPFKIKLDKTYHDTSLDTGKIAPGTSGSFDIELKNSTTETAVDVNVAIAKKNVPTNLKFYTDSTYTTEFSNAELNAVLKANDTTGLKKTIYWKWAYNETANETIDGADTDNGKAATDANAMEVTLTITGTQIAPSTTAVTSEWK